MATIKLYELVARDNLYWSPNSWKTRMCLNLKKISYESVALGIVQVKKILPDIVKKDVMVTPVIDDNGIVIEDSFEIAKYLENKYPNLSIFHNNIALHNTIYNWLEPKFSLALIKLVIPDLCKAFNDEDREYFIITRTQFLGDLNMFSYSDNMEIVQETLTIVLKTLENNKFISGEKIGWADIVLASWLLSAKLINETIFNDVKNKCTNQDVFERWWNDVQFLIK